MESGAWVFLTHPLTQALTGHGVFRHYLHRIGRAADTSYLFCSHTKDLFNCPQWNPHRVGLRRLLGRDLCPEDVQDLLYGFPVAPDGPSSGIQRTPASAATKHELITMIEGIVNVKMEDEKQRQVLRRSAGDP